MCWVNLYLQLFTALIWIAIGVIFMLCYVKQPTVEEHGSTPANNTSTTRQNGENDTNLTEVDNGDNDDESGKISEVRSESDRSHDILEITAVSASVVSYRENISSEMSAMSSQQLSSTLSSAMEEETSDRAVHKSCCHWLCSASRRIYVHLLWGFSMLIWEEIVLLLYVISIMIFTEMAVQVSRIVFYRLIISIIMLIHTGLLHTTCRRNFPLE